MTFPYAVLPALVLLAAPGRAAGDEGDGGYYLELGAGLATFSEIDTTAGSADFESGYSLDVLLGHRWCQVFDTGLDFSLEGEAYYAKVGLDDQLLIPSSSLVDYLAHGGVLLGGVIDWPCSEHISFYGGAGAGLATSLTLDSKGDASSEIDLEDDTAFIVQGKLGVRYTMAQNLSWFLQYKHLQSEDITASDSFLDQSFDFDIAEDAVEVGVRWGL